jgi:general secretion pathway protein A
MNGTMPDVSKMLALYGLKWNPFAPSLPPEGIFPSPRLDSFSRRCEMYLREGGFAMLTGAPGVGKSVTLRMLHDRLARQRDVVVRAITHPQSGVTDFYRELGDLFGVPLSPHNRWGGFKAVREKWQAHIDATLIRPVLVIDEAQEMPSSGLNELRLLASRDYDSHALLFVVLAGDGRLREKLRAEELLPLRSRVRTHLELDFATPAELAEALRFVIGAAGNAHLLTASVVTALAEHAAGNYRTLMTMAGELLAVGADRDVRQLDEKLFFEVFAVPQPPSPAGPKARRR